MRLFEFITQFPTSIKAIAAIITVLLLLNLNFLIKTPQNNTAVVIGNDNELQTGLALITKSVDIKGAKLITGPTLEKGKLQFQEGLLQIELFSGASLIIEGPADIDLIDAMNIHCIEGKIRARVSAQAKGFKITTADMNIVDLGTEFSLIGCSPKSP